LPYDHRDVGVTDREVSLDSAADQPEQRPLVTELTKRLRREHTKI